ncbi:ATP-dependent helicase [Mesorhizobium sp. BR115XR7A]|uniref:UvrD-helicase domain-containing protein n=1 Tax=Mesorhizobium sp. BR115XR7A TaxID=2876645 RepID=UPI001CCEC935|nr:ATP-dependent helicase [Mesorhizobium sp. BR115XR7A]MBZ9905271.1 ATP-dependent helicase [Mesorhizobium sp. BR115XR7A]MBZ9931054.1 ATP-dependent helicase [Mesorhizobium sp. BR1-1-5]
MFVWNKDDLNDEQEAAVNEEKNVFLVACPGSGKTRALTYKIASQLSKLESEKQWVVAITYTHRAADEIHERIENLGVDTSQLWIGTIHSFCLEWILKPYAIYHDALKYGFRVINSHDTERLLSEVCSPYRYPNITHWDCNHYYTPAGRVLTCHAPRRLNVASALDQYHALLLQNRQIDFELILHFAHELIISQPTISKLLSSLFSYVLVDEYQDTKEIQYAILASILRAGGGKVGAFIVGDPNQAIYGSLGGYAITAAEFSEMAGVDFKEMDLSRNYRSSERIVGYFGNYNVYATKISAEGKDRQYASLISFDPLTARDGLEEELVRLVRYSIETAGIAPNEICILAPQWVHLASMTRRLVAALPEYGFDGPGMVPFARDIDNFWYKLSKIVLTQASPHMYVRRFRWIGDVLGALGDAGVAIGKLTRKSLLRTCNSITIGEEDGLAYLEQFFDALFATIGVDFRAFPALAEHHDAFFESSRARIQRLQAEGAEYIGEIATFKRVFEGRKGITVSTIHGVKGAEYDTVISYALLEGMVPNFNDLTPAESACKLLYVIGSRARKNLHLLSERGRQRGGGWGEYQPTTVLADCQFAYDKVP